MAAARRTALWSPEALEDREKIWDYYVGVAGWHAAEKALREVGKVIALIEEHPFAGRGAAIDHHAQARRQDRTDRQHQGDVRKEEDTGVIGAGTRKAGLVSAAQSMSAPLRKRPNCYVAAKGQKRHRAQFPKYRFI
jgi:plasmid stabilization system protein ParE